MSAFKSFFGFGSNVSMATKELVEKAIAENTVVIFSKSWCGFSRSAKNLIAGLKLDPSKPVKIYELDEMDEGDAIQSYLKTRTGQGTVPNVFINQKHIGGLDDLRAFQASGELNKLLGL